MRFKHRMIVFEAADLDAESAFWAGLLEGTVQAGDRWHNIWVDGTWQLGVQLAPDHVAPQWPDDASSQQVHLDFYLEDLEAAHEKVIALGGRLLKGGRRSDRAVRFPGLRRSRRPPLLPVLARTSGVNRLA